MVAINFSFVGYSPLSNIKLLSFDNLGPIQYHIFIYYYSYYYMRSSPALRGTASFSTTYIHSTKYK